MSYCRLQSTGFILVQTTSEPTARLEPFSRYIQEKSQITRETSKKLSEYGRLVLLFWI